MSGRSWLVSVVLGVSCLAALGLASRPSFARPPGGTKGKGSFQWPAGKRAAISLSFDDARLSQPDVGLALLDRLGVKATFFVNPANVEKRLEGWKKIVASGHEIANHTLTHPCSGNFLFARANALEDKTLEMMAKDMDGCNAEIERLLGVKAKTFAYPCGQKFVGRGRGVKSYVPLAAERFLVARGYLDEAANDPAYFDFAQAAGTGFDDMDFPQMKQLVLKAAEEGRWIIFVGHEIGPKAFQTTDTAALEALVKYARDPANGLWLDCVRTVGQYIHEQRTR
jgi:peptidoglycan/xylan/chitin deacetylase (PgdA/CDA1 family)